MQNRYPGRRVRQRDVTRGGRYFNAQEWYCEGCDTHHSGYRDSTAIEGKLYCDHALYQRQKQIRINQQD